MCNCSTPVPAIRDQRESAPTQGKLLNALYAVLRKSSGLQEDGLVANGNS
jgi:hypothetical protein